jgi:hypothetical protein
MKKFRLKKEAVPFVLEKHATSVYSLDTWESCGIDIKALEEVEPAFITHGRKMGENSATLGGWSKDEGTTFEFTIHFPSVNFYEHDKFAKGRVTRDLMNRIQSQINNFYDQFLDGEIPESCL